MTLGSQQSNFTKTLRRVSTRQRFLAGLVFLAILAALSFLHWAAVNNKINVGWLLGPCGFKQKYGLPCPGCGMTTAAIAFVKGEVLQAFYIQPAAALVCLAAVVIAVFALVVAILGTDFGLIRVLISEWRTKTAVLALIIVIGAAWAVTLARALAESGP